MAYSAVLKFYKKDNFFFIIIAFLLFKVVVVFWVAYYFIVQSFMRKIRLKHLIDCFVFINVLFGICLKIIEILVINWVLFLYHSVENLKTHLVAFELISVH